MINYLDNGATSFPKPCGVLREINRCMATYCGNPGRGSHKMALAAQEKLLEARTLAAKLFGSPYPDGAVLTLNATYALNLAILGLVRAGDHVIISDLEHNSVLRPTEYLKRTAGVEYSVFSTVGDVAENVVSLIRKNTRAVICTHASNITNRAVPIEDIGRALSGRGILFIVDASQSAGSIGIDMERMGIDVLCAPGHKGLLGPQGIGIAMFRRPMELETVITGGSGVHSRLLEMPDDLPDRLEAGTLPTPAAAGLCEGLKYVLSRGEEDIRKEETRIIDKIRDAFEDDRRIFTYSEGEGGIWLFNIKGVPSQTTSYLLDKRDVCTRPGLHCSPLAHRTLGTPEDGAVRVSAGALTQQWQADFFIRAFRDILEHEI